MAETIGTNVVADDEILRVMEKLLQEFDKVVRERKLSEYEKMMSNLAKHVGKGGKLCYDTVYNGDDARMLESILKQKGVDYCPIRSDNGEQVLFLIKDTEKDRRILAEAKEAVMNVSTNFNKEVPYEDVIRSCIERHSDIAELHVDNPGWQWILSEKLFQNNLVTGVNPNEQGSLVVDSMGYIRDSGRDLVLAEFEYALTQSYEDISEGMGTIREEQSLHDRKTLMRFAEAVKNMEPGEHLVDLKTMSAIDIAYNEEGKCEIRYCEQGKQPYRIMDANSLADKSIAEIAGRISQMANEKHLYNRVLADEIEYQKIKGVDENARIKTAKDLGCEVRPTFTEEQLRIHQASAQLQSVLMKISAQATLQTKQLNGYDHMTDSKKYSQKKAIFADMVKESPLVQQWLSGESLGVDAKTKQALLDKAVEHFINPDEKTYNEVHVKTTSWKEWEQKLNIMDKDKPLDMDMDSEKEQNI